jgi:hypothetical protein
MKADLPEVAVVMSLLSAMLNIREEGLNKKYYQSTKYRKDNF